MLLAYVDESYTRDRYSMVALPVSYVQVISLTRALDEVVAGAGQAYGVVPEELHGTDLLHSDRGWEPIVKMPRATIGVYRAGFLVIADHEVLRARFRGGPRGTMPREGEHRLGG